MTCHRCTGLMVRERFDDIEFGSAGHEIFGWRCLNCGAIVDPVIAARHATTYKIEPNQVRLQRLTRC